MDRRDVAGHEDDWFIRLDKKRMIAVVELCAEDEEGDYEEEVEIPFIYEVCDVCGGKGTHVNPSIDSHGITADEWAEWDDDDREDYFSGAYDVECYECGGEKVVPVPNYDYISKEFAERVREHIESLHSYAIERTREMEMEY